MDAAPSYGELSNCRSKEDVMSDDPYLEMIREQWDNIVMVYVAEIRSFAVVAVRRFRAWITTR